MIRPMLCAALTTLGLACVSQAIAAAPRYTMTQLRAVSVAAGVYANVADINRDGLAVGEETKATGPATFDYSVTRGLAWSSGSGNPTVLATPAGQVGASAWRVNSAGQVVGVAYSTNTTAATRAPSFLGTGGSSVFRTTGGTVDGINAAGDVVGDDEYLYRSGTVSTIRAGTFDASTFDILDINDAGTILAQTRFPLTQTLRPFRASTTVDPVAIVNVNAGAAAINNAGMVAGFLMENGTTQVAARFTANGTVTRIGTLATTGTVTQGSLTTDLNNRGDVVGFSGPPTGTTAEQRAFLFRDGVLTELSTLIDGGTLPLGFKPTAINDRGQIVGNAYIDHDNNASTPKIGVAYPLDPVRLAGDANGDGRVDVADLGVLATNYGSSTAAFYETGDFNYDWRVDVADLGLLATNYGSPRTLAADLAAFGLTAVPEPAVVAAALALPAVAGRRRRARPRYDPA